MAPFLIHGVVQHSLRDGLVCHVVYPLYLQTLFFFSLNVYQVSRIPHSMWRLGAVLFV
ncbi:unnamed protein product [Ixodes persulcatus]